MMVAKLDWTIMSSLFSGSLNDYCESMCILMVFVTSSGNSQLYMKFMDLSFVIQGCLNNPTASILSDGSLWKHNNKKSLHSYEIPYGKGGQSS